MRYEIMIVKEYMTGNPITVDEGLSVLEAADLMKKNKVRRFPVLRNDELVGIVTDRDLRSAGPSQVISLDGYERELMPELYGLLTKVKIKDIMCRDLITINPEKTIVTAAVLMLKHKISGVPVVNSKREIVGIITESDIFKALVDFSGSQLGKILLGFHIEDRPGSIKEVMDVIRGHGGRPASILSTYRAEDPQFRRVYIRIMDHPAVDLKALEKDLRQRFELLFVMEDFEEVTKCGLKDKPDV
jgi:acetoin utilization protein AcuB